MLFAGVARVGRRRDTLPSSALACRRSRPNPRGSMRWSRTCRRRPRGCGSGWPRRPRRRRRSAIRSSSFDASRAPRGGDAAAAARRRPRRRQPSTPLEPDARSDRDRGGRRRRPRRPRSSAGGRRAPDGDRRADGARHATDVAAVGADAVELKRPQRPALRGAWLAKVTSLTSVIGGEPRAAPRRRATSGSLRRLDPPRPIQVHDADRAAACRGPARSCAMLTPWRPRIVPTSPMTPG